MAKLSPDIIAAERVLVRLLTPEMIRSLYPRATTGFMCTDFSDETRRMCTRPADHSGPHSFVSLFDHKSTICWPRSSNEGS